MNELTEWKNSLPAEWHIYALIDPLADNQPLQYWYQHAEPTDCWPLYAGTEWSDDILSGPWLLPLAQLSSWESWWQQLVANEYATGLLLASACPPEKLVRHWQSLLTAGLDGEEVLFRYYDPRILGPMLFAFTEEETRRFLGPTHELLLWHQGGWLSAVPYLEPDLTEHHEPWWRMKDAHFAGQPGEKNIVLFNLEQWLWRNANELTTACYEQHGAISTQLEALYPQAMETIPVLWQPSWMILHLTGFPHWWPDIRQRPGICHTDEQRDLMLKVIQQITKTESSEKEAR